MKDNSIINKDGNIFWKLQSFLEKILLFPNLDLIKLSDNFSQVKLFNLN